MKSYLSGAPRYYDGGGITVEANVYDIKGECLCIEDTYIEDNELVRNRYTDYLNFDFDDVKKAAKIEIDAYQEDQEFRSEEQYIMSRYKTRD